MDNNEYERKAAISIIDWKSILVSHFRNPICFFRFVKALFARESFPNGHVYAIVEDENIPENIEIIKCETCGHTSIGWYPDVD